MQKMQMCYNIEENIEENLEENYVRDIETKECRVC